jgi:phosphatidyl-myo-inositol alpha-mannosyltransferase
MKIGIVVPFSWSYWGGVVEHAENQASALRARGHDVQILMGHDPPGVKTRLLHPRTGRHGDLPSGIIPIGRSVVVPANGSLPNVVLSPRAMLRVRDVLAEQQFDLLHLHEPMTPVICVVSLAYANCPVVGTWHAAGDLAWMRAGLKAWGFLADRIDARIAVSRMAAESAARWLGPGFEIVPNGVVVPEQADALGREHQIVFIGRHDARKGLPVLLEAWPAIRRASGARLRLIGTDPLQYRLLHSRMRFDEDGIDVLGIVSNEVRARELAAAKIFVSPALGGESFGMVLVEAFAEATPVIASNIPGFADVAVPDAATLVPPGDAGALADAVVGLLADEERRVAMGRAGRALAEERYAWPDVALRLEKIYERVSA